MRPTPWRSTLNHARHPTFTHTPHPQALYDSGSGERGLFSRAACRKQVLRSGGRRDPGWDFGTNPCSEIILRPYQFCNLTEVVVRQDDDAQSLARKVRAARGQRQGWG